MSVSARLCCALLVATQKACTLSGHLLLVVQAPDGRLTVKGCRRIAQESEERAAPPAAPSREVSLGRTRHPLLGVAVPHGRRSGAARGQTARLPAAHWTAG